jgi:glycogen synthase
MSQDFSWEHAAEEYEALYKSLLHGGNTQGHSG